MGFIIKRVALAGVLAVVFSLSAPNNVMAEEKKIEINTSFTIKQILGSFAGQRVALKTDAGDTIEGTVTSVGDHVVHITKLSGKDYYDAVVVIDRISSAVFRAKGN
jgi:hypothetical protein